MPEEQEQKQETVREACDHLRDAARNIMTIVADFTNDPGSVLLELADRVERASERECEIARDLGRIDRESDNMARAADALEKAFAPGNAAVMHDLLEKIRHEYGWGRIGCRTCVSSEADVERVHDLFAKQIDAALAAPARNCDRSEHWEDLWLEFGKLWPDVTDDLQRAWLFVRWLFAPAKEGEAK